MTTEQLIELIESTANMLRGMCFDPRIPTDTKQAMQSRMTALEAAVDDWNRRTGATHEQ